MTKPMIRIHDTAKDEIVDREMTDAEYSELLEMQEKNIKDVEGHAKVKANKEAAIAKLAALGLDLDDLAALGF